MIASKIRRCICCMRICNEWGIANIGLCVHCERHGALIFDLQKAGRMNAPFGAEQVWVAMCNEAPEMKGKLVRIEVLFQIAGEMDMQEADSPGGGGLIDYGAGHFSGFLKARAADGVIDRKPIHAVIPHRGPHGRIKASAN
jgi:hypothetical protein